MPLNPEATGRPSWVRVEPPFRPHPDLCTQDRGVVVPWTLVSGPFWAAAPASSGRPLGASCPADQQSGGLPWPSCASRGPAPALPPPLPSPPHASAACVCGRVRTLCTSLVTPAGLQHVFVRGGVPAGVQQALGVSWVNGWDMGTASRAQRLWPADVARLCPGFISTQFILARGMEHRWRMLAQAEGRACCGAWASGHVCLCLQVWWSLSTSSLMAGS